MLKKFKIIFGILMIVTVLLSMVYVVIFKTTDRAPVIFGMTIYRTPYEDMEPEISAGEIVVIQDIDPKDVKYGDAVIYKDFRENDYVIQQVTKEPYEENGVYYFTTRALGTTSVDSPEFDESALRGKVIFKIPYLGTIYDFVTNWYGIVAVIVILLVIYGKDIINLISRFRMRNQSDDIDGKHNNIEDLRQSQCIEVVREQEFSDIILDLEDLEE